MHSQIYQVYLGITSIRDVGEALVSDILSTSEKYFSGPRFWPQWERAASFTWLRDRLFYVLLLFQFSVLYESSSSSRLEVWLQLGPSWPELISNIYIYGVIVLQSHLAILDLRNLPKLIRYSKLFATADPISIGPYFIWEGNAQPNLFITARDSVCWDSIEQDMAVVNNHAIGRLRCSYKQGLSTGAF